MDEPQDVDPQWDLLPADPRGFFGLGQGDGPGELRRAYTRLLRRFKPETEPQRFQQLRGSYEALLEELRFLDSLGDEPFARTAHAGTPLEHGPATAVVRLDPVALLRERGPEGVRESLRESVASEGGDDAEAWLWLALVEEELRDDDPLAFAAVVAEGLRATRGDPRLHWLFRVGLDGLDDVDAARGLLALLEREASPERPGSAVVTLNLWSLADPAWALLQDELELADFQALLKPWRERFGTSPSFPAFLGRTWRRSLGSKGSDWSRDLREEFQGLVPPGDGHLGQLFDVGDWIARRVTCDEGTWSGSPLRRRVGEAVRRVAFGEEPRAEQAFLEAMTACVDAPSDVLDAFRVEEKALCGSIDVLEWYGDSRTQHDEDEGPHLTRSDWEAVVSLQRTLQRAAYRSPVAWAWGVTLFVYAVFLMSTLSIPIAVGNAMAKHGYDTAAVLGAIVALVALLIALSGTEARVRRGTSRPFVRLIHRLHWRRRIADLMVRMRMSDERLVRILSCPEFKRYGYRDWVVLSIREDPGLRLLGLARGTCG